MKTSKALLERKRPLFFMAGLVFAFSITLVSFEWRTPYEYPVLPDCGLPPIEYPQGYLVTLPETEKKVEKPELPKVEKPTFEIKLAENNAVTETSDPTVLTPENVEDHKGTDFKAVEAEVADVAPYDWVPKMPVYCSGPEDMMKVMYKNLNYPKVPLDNGVSGVVVVQFTVTKSGAVKDVQVARSVDPWLDAEALRVVKMLDCFEPGQQGGRNVDVFLKLPVRFSIE
ncbi:MAG: TonB family protein [Flavobacteriales bacterium]|nr:TonB family protein [Flavobacteriales bacterium]